MRFVFLAVVSSWLFFACGPTSSTCSESNCAGCCSAAGECVGGTLETACGSAGLLCNSCSGGQVCVAQRCEFPAVDAGVVSFDAGTPILPPAETWTWAGFPTSACGNGAPTGLGVNLTTRSKDLLIYLQGGGACWNALSCEYTATNLKEGYDGAAFAAEGQLQAPPFSRVAMNNPFKDMSFVFVPYCTGDVHAGDAVKDYPAFVQGPINIPARTVSHKGGKNMEAFLLRLKDTFPDAQRVFISGSSAGAYGAQLNFERVRATWPDAQVHLLADCGQTVTPAGTLFGEWLAAWNLAVPADCTDCGTNFAKYPQYLHAKYPASRFGLLAYTQDNTLRQFSGLDATTFQQRTLELTASAYDPTSNAKYFVLAGATHVMLGDFFTLQSPGGVKLVDWTAGLVSGAPAWQSVKP